MNDLHCMNKKEWQQHLAMVEALKWYADAQHYMRQYADVEYYMDEAIVMNCGTTTFIPVITDNGKCARAALRSTKEEER